MNSGITRYIYPSGQCEESCRDQGHTQLGLSYFVNTALWRGTRVSIFSQRPTTGWRSGLSTRRATCWARMCPLTARSASRRGGKFSDLYQAVLQHYRYEKHMEMPYTERAAAKVTACAQLWRRCFAVTAARSVKLKPAPEASKIASNGGRAGKAHGRTQSAGAISVAPGKSIQDALDKLKANGGGTMA